MYDPTMTNRGHEELRAAYTRAIYRADLEPEPVYLRVGEPSPALDRWLAAQGARRFAFVSAANPGSRPLSEAENKRRHLALVECVQKSGLKCVAGESYEAASGGWREASLLVCGIERQAAIALARDFGQVALLLGEAGAAVELVFTAAATKEG